MPLSSKGVQAISDLFHMVDVNRSGVIEWREHQNAKKQLHGMMMPKSRWDWTDMDTNGDGKISMSEWHEAFLAIADTAGEEHLLAGVVRSWAELKGSIGEGPNQTNYSDQSSVKILSKFRNFR